MKVVESIATPLRAAQTWPLSVAACHVLGEAGLISRNPEHPATAELVIEVCVTSHDYDRSKLPVCASAGMKESWHVPGQERQIEVHRAPLNGQFAQRETHRQSGKFASPALPDVAVELDAFFNP